METILPAGQRDRMFTKLQSDFIAQMMPKKAAWMEEPGVKKIFDDFIAEASAKQLVIYKKHLPDQINAIAAAYTREFSPAEIDDIYAFAQTSTGKHYLSRSMAIIGDPEVAKVNSVAMAEIRETTTALVPAFKAKLVAYIGAHPELQDKIKAEMATPQ